jgi:hypothetical protein
LSLEPNACRRLPEADQSRFCSGSRRKALSTDVKCLQKVRLAGPVLPNDKDEPRLEAQVERSVRAKAPERGSGDDQPASLIGMIR